MSAIEQRILEKTWFYRFQLPNGTITSTYDDGALDGIHTSRLAMLQTVIDARFGGTLAGRSAIDIACHQGWFATKLAQWKADDVLAIDARSEHVADTTLMRDALALSNLRVQQSDVHALEPAALGQFDLVLMLGLIYHLENPIGALRQAHALTRQACVVETQVVPGMSGMVDYGSYRFVRPLKGSFGIIDETDDTHGPEASTTGICLVPSTEALMWIMRKIGFARVEILPPPADAYEQLLHGKRVMVVGYVD
ncbi:MAG: class I SAM-dependent methyltransferase [Dokdonella sp.]|uniref:class I SAM-dependent methyltransferase n=1 Tax=Dokdonella sp. TaxID=2291710 RepID=UPI0032671DC8